MAKKSRRTRWPSAYNPIDVHVGTRLRARRTLLGLSQTAVGNAVGITFQQLQKYENGLNRISAGRLYDLARILDVDMAYFFDEMDEGTKKASPAQLGHRETKESSQKPPKSENPLHRRETLELVRAYYRILNPTVRDHLRKLVQATASASGRPT